jgi:hypothetical protein
MGGKPEAQANPRIRGDDKRMNRSQTGLGLMVCGIVWAVSQLLLLLSHPSGIAIVGTVLGIVIYLFGSEIHGS